MKKYLWCALLLGACMKPATDSEKQQDKYDPSQGVLTIRFLDVGQGDSVLITSPEGKNVVYDGGKSTKAIAKYISTYQLKKLELMIASHADFDHISGLNVFADLKPKYFINNGIASNTETYRKLVRKLKTLKVQGVVASDRSIKLGEHTVLHVLSLPPADSKSDADDQNLNSVGLVIEQGSFKAFLGGDSEPQTTDFWLSQYGTELKNINVYKASHHGSKHNDTDRFLQVLSPEIITVSVGDNNYGHPSPEAMQRYQKYARTVYRTDEDGTITVKVDLQGYYRTSKEQ